MGTQGCFPSSQVLLPGGAPPSRVAGLYGFFSAGGKSGDGIPSLVGTVTIQADAAGTFRGGALHLPSFGGFSVVGVDLALSFSGGPFTVVPEPGTAMLALLGLSGVGLMGRKRR